MDRRERLEELLAEAHERQASGGPFDAESFAGEHPEFAGEILRHLRVVPLAQWALRDSRPPGERERARAAIRARLDTDRAKGDLRDSGHYKNLFPGFWDVVAEEYGGLPDARATTPGDGAVPRGVDQEVIGAYRVLKEIGRGGMGVVYLAEDTRLRRNVALKVLSPVFASSRDLQRRFQREAAIASKLDHPGICTVYEAGEARGIPYIAMRFVQGETLEHWISAARIAAGLGERASLGTAPSGPAEVPAAAAPQRPPLKRTTGAGTRDEILRIVHLAERTARALHEAHEASLIHRDIKPGNIMVTREGDPIILDFGLARDDEGTGASITQTGALMGTPAYMSPEQIAAQRIRLDRRTDVYSLGVTLYEALTLRLPFTASSRDSLYQKILVSEPDNVRRLNPSIPVDLKVVIDKALEKDRDRRYPTALEFGEDLRRVREDEPVKARPVGPITRAGRWIQRNPGIAVPTLGFVGLVITLPPAAFYLYEKGRQSAMQGLEQGWTARMSGLKEKFGTSGDPTVVLGLGKLDEALRLWKAGFARPALDSAKSVVDTVGSIPEAKELKVAAELLIKEINREQGN